MQIILAAAGIPLPSRAAENRQPVIRRCAICLRISPYIPVGFRVAAIAPALGKPGMAIGRVRQHLVDHDLQAQFVGALHQAIKVGQAAEQGIDVAII